MDKWRSTKVSQAKTSLQKGFTSKHLNDKLFEKILAGIYPDAIFVKWHRSKLNTSNSILSSSSVADEEITSYVGLFGFSIQYRRPTDNKGVYRFKQIVLKCKPRAEETINTISKIAYSISLEYGKVFDQFKNSVCIVNIDHKEISLLNLKDESVNAIQPSVYFIWCEPQLDIFVYATEDFNAEHYSHIDTVNDTSVWTEQDIVHVLQDVASMHARYYGRGDELPASVTQWMDKPLTVDSSLSKQRLWHTSNNHNAKLYPKAWPQRTEKLVQILITNIENVCRIISMSPDTIVHNDFNVRNLCLRPQPIVGKKRLCLYDWELTCLAPPQHDIAEFLCSVLPTSSGSEVWYKYLQIYWMALVAHIPAEVKEKNSVSVALIWNNFMNVFDMCVIEYMWNRLNLLGLVHFVHHFQFFERIVKVATEFIIEISSKYPFLKGCNNLD